eukprot:SAG31_NODE_1276_length_9044_cov_10.002236_6_plen_79_part_00
MRDKGLTLLNVRKHFSMLGTATQAASAVLFVLAPTPLLACAASCCQYVPVPTVAHLGLELPREPMNCCYCVLLVKYVA